MAVADAHADSRHSCCGGSGSDSHLAALTSACRVLRRRCSGRSACNCRVGLGYPPEVIEKWRRGAEGSEYTGKAVQSLTRKGWQARHDLKGKYGNLDHIVSGPGGVFLLDSKNLSGTARIEDGVFRVHFDVSPINDYSLTRLPRWMNGAAFGLREELHARLGWIVDVVPVVVVCGYFPQRIEDCDGVACVALDALVDWLEQQPTRLSDRDAVTVAAAINDLPLAEFPETPRSTRTTNDSRP